MTALVDNSLSTEATAQETRLIELYEAGVPSAKIARMLRMPASSVRNKLGRLRDRGRLAAVAPVARAAIGAPKIGDIIESIEAEAARQSAVARMDYRDAAAAALADHRARQAGITAQERETLKAIERWRVGAIAAAEGRPVTLADVRSVKREDVDAAGAGRRI